MDERGTAIERHTAVLLMVVDDFEWYNKRQIGSTFQAAAQRRLAAASFKLRLTTPTCNLNPEP